MSKDGSSLRVYEILVVDDNPDDVDLFLRTLRKVQVDLEMAVKPVAVADGNQALERIRRQKFDAIFLDMNLPPPDGMELARQIRNSAINRTTSVVMISGSEDRDLLSRAFQAGVNFFLAKPVDKVRLLRLLHVARVPIDRERRRLQRVKVQCKVAIESGKDRMVGETLDISLLGMFVRAPHVLPTGSIVSLALTLPGDPIPMQTAARVVRVVGTEFMGMQLENMGGVETDKLAAFLEPMIADALETKVGR